MKGSLKKSRVSPKKNVKKKDAVLAETTGPGKWDAACLIAGLIFLVAAVFSFIAILSYTISWDKDQSFFTDPNALSTDIDKVANDGGSLGLVFARFAVTKLFGLGAFLIPFFFLGIAVYCLRYRKVNILRLTFLTLFGCILISLLGAYFFSFSSSDDWFGSGAGGAYGYYIVAWLKKTVGAVAAGGILLLCTVLWLTVASKKFVSWFFSVTDRTVSTKSSAGEETTIPWNEMTDDGEDAEDDEVKEDTEPETEDAAEVDMTEGNEESEVDESATVKKETETPRLEIIEPAGESQIEEITPQQGEEPPLIETCTPNNKEDDFLSVLSEDEKRHLFDPRLELSQYRAPSTSLLEDYRDKWYQVSSEELERNNKQIVRTLANYKIGVSKVSARIGPTVTLYEIVPAPGVRVSQIKRLEEDIQLSLAARGVRVVTLPGTNAIGIEVANEHQSIVSMKSVLEDKKFNEAKYELPIALGKTITGKVLTFDLAKMPHLLVAGATGQGKSVGLNVIINSLLFRKHPSELKLVLVDPKKVELSVYSKLDSHFLAMLPDADEPVVTDTQKVIYTLKSLCSEMDSRYDLLKMAGVRNIKEYNEKYLERRLNPLKGHRYLPYIVVVIDEYADMMMTAGKDIEEPIARLAQLARAIGIHLVIATQRPTTSVITGNIKANFPARIAFMVRSSIDSRTILDEVGANQLIGHGDMLISSGGDLTRVQCAFIDTKEIERVVDYISGQQGYTTPFYLPEYVEPDKDGDSHKPGETDLAQRDALFEDAAKIIVMAQTGSTSLLQRKLGLGYNRAGRLIDQLEKAGIVGPLNKNNTREVYIEDLALLDSKLSEIRQIYG
ncbi:MAG: DNA translocase FtsK [Bacteroidales bacterium]|jgi:S-DNA-T family DNA segregation ATPase FtsK/SpoIIIE|nr:DNA translocase FtsK [Bacteroidales bacterium]